MEVAPRALQEHQQGQQPNLGFKVGFLEQLT